MARSYPKIKFIGRVMRREQFYKCEFCGKSMTNKRVDIQVDDKAENDEVFFFHSGCLAGMKEVQILAKLYPDHFAEIQE